MPTGLCQPMVHPIQEKIAPPLRREIADWQSARTLCHHRPVIAWQKDERNLSACSVTLQHLVDQLHNFVTANDLPELFAEYLVIDVWEKLAHITFEDVLKSVGQMPAAFPCSRRAFAHLTRETSGNETTLQERIHLPTERMMDYSISKWGGGDKPAFGFADLEEMVGTGLIPARQQLFTELGQFGFSIPPPLLDIGTSAFASSRGMIGGKQIIPRRDTAPMFIRSALRNLPINTNRKPMLLFRLPGSLLLRLQERRLPGSLLFHDPPRTTR